MPLSHKKILIVDDATSIRTFLRILLQNLSAELYEADTAEGGLKVCQDIHPNLIILDLGLPDRDGLEIIEELKTMKHNGEPPVVIVLTVRKDPHIRSKALKLGADDYVTKPFMVENFIDLVKEKLHLTT